MALMRTHRGADQRPILGKVRHDGFNVAGIQRTGVALEQITDTQAVLNGRAERVNDNETSGIGI